MSILRQQLIAAERKFRDLKIKSFQDDLTEARRRLKQARMPDPYAGFFAVVCVGLVMGMVCVVVSVCSRG
jgi:hypothetical protein